MKYYINSYYDQGRKQGQEDVKSNPKDYGVATPKGKYVTISIVATYNGYAAVWDVSENHEIQRTGQLVNPVTTRGTVIVDIETGQIISGNANISWSN